MKARRVGQSITIIIAIMSVLVPVATVPYGYAIILVNPTAHLIAHAGSAPNITVTPKPFNGSNSLVTFLDYAMYAAWIFVFGLIIYAAFEAREGALSPGVKKALGGAIAAAFLLTFGWSILTGVI